jgi:hypothetical protein
MRIGTIITFAASVIFTCLLAAPVQAGFTKGPSVRVVPGMPVKVQISWSADFVGLGSVALFEGNDGSGAPVASNTTSSTGNDHVLGMRLALRTSMRSIVKRGVCATAEEARTTAQNAIGSFHRGTRSNMGLSFSGREHYETVPEVPPCAGPVTRPLSR